jgi:hypothetical protein
LRGHQLCSRSIVSQHFIKPRSSLLHSQELSICPYTEPDQSNPHHPILSLQPTSILLVFLVVSFPLTFPPITYVCVCVFPIPATCPTHLILYDLIILNILGEEYNHKVPHYAAFITLQWPHPYWVQIYVLFSTLCSQSVLLPYCQ